MRILFVTQNLPYPIDSGSKIRTANLVKLLMQNNEVKCLFMPSRRMDIGEFKSSCPPSIDYTIARPLERRKFARGYEYFTAPFVKRPEILKALQREIEVFQPEVAWLDYLFIGQYIDWLGRYGVPVIYGTHNAQSCLTKQQAIAAKYIPKKLQLSVMALLHSIHEKIYFKKAAKVVCVSKQDLKFHANFVESDRLALVPNFIDIEDYNAISPFEGKQPYICFVGSIDNFQNAEGIKYFISKIWGKVAQAIDVRLLVIGRGAGRDKVLMNLVGRYDNIQLVEDVDSVVPFIKGSLVSIVPLLQGSGTRLKIIESMACMSAVVSTTRGAEGIDAVNGRDILISDDENEFAGMIIRLVTDKEYREIMGKNAHDFAIKNFGFDSVRATVMQILSNPNASLS